MRVLILALREGLPSSLRRGVKTKRNTQHPEFDGLSARVCGQNMVKINSVMILRRMNRL
jgi:hypothetical protein